MPLDPSIILGAGQGVTPLQNPMDVMGKAMNYQNALLQSQNLAMQNQVMRQQYNDEQALRIAAAQNTHVDESGNYSQDRKGILKSLADTAPNLVQKTAIGFQQQDLATMQAQVEKGNIMAQVGGGAKNQQEWNDSLATMNRYGLDTSRMPTVFDPEYSNHLQSYGMTAAQQAQNAIAQQNANTEALGEKNKEQQLAIERQEAFGSGAS